jgi:hypothetical protein
MNSNIYIEVFNMLVVICIPRIFRNRFFDHVFDKSSELWLIVILTIFGGKSETLFILKGLVLYYI